MVYKCEICGKEYTKLFNYNYHKAHHSDARPFACEFQDCTNAYKTKADLRQHMKSHEKSLGISFHCLECNLQFETSTKLNVHKRDNHFSVLKSKSWCEQCNRHFTNLRSHLKIVHEKEKAFTCDLDGKTFSKAYGLVRHIEGVHLNLAPYSCDQCHKKFKEASALKRHLEIHKKVVQHFVRKSRKRTSLPEEWSEDEQIVTERKRIKCGLCYISFSSEASLLKHENLRHLDATFICDICPRRFLIKPNLKVHMNRDHSDQNIFEDILMTTYKCGACKKTLNSRSALDRHKQNVHLAEYDFMCERCSATFSDRNGLNKHLAKKHNVKLISDTAVDCLECGKTFLSAWKLEQHELACQLRKQETLNRKLDKEHETAGDIRHVEDETDEIKVKIEEPLQSNAVFLEIDQFKQETPIKNEFSSIQKESINDPFDSDAVISAVFEDKRRIEVKEYNYRSTTHRKTISREVRSNKVQRETVISNLKEITFDFKQETNESDESEEESKNINEEILKDKKCLNQMAHKQRLKVFCDQCGISFATLRLLKNHITTSHPTVKLETEEKAIVRRRKTTQPVRCDNCGETVFGKTGLFTHRWNKHFNIRIIKKKYHCLICREVLKCSNSAKKHHEQVHLQGEKLVRSCIECNLNFTLFDDFKRHVDEIHEYDFVCLLCGVCMHSSIEYSNHTKLHRSVPEEQKKLSCDLCGFRVQQKISIISHMVSKHGASKKNYHGTCEYCGVTFNCYQSFHSHMKTHLDPSDRKFKCNFCNKSFTKPVYLRDHERTHTNPDDKPYHCEYDSCSKKYASYDSYRGHIHFSHKRNRNQCRVCNDILASKEKLIAHIDVNHPELRRFSCSYCGKSFASQLANAKHMINCEPATID